MKRSAWAVTLLLVVACIFLGWSHPSSAGGVVARVGFVAPDFTLETPSGQVVTLTSLRGKPVLVNFWASWCPPCKREMPDIRRFYDNHPGGVQVLGVDLGEPAATVQAFTGANGYRWTFLLDRDLAVKSRYQVRFVPTSFFVDKQGVIRRIYAGPMNLPQIRSFWQQAGGALRGAGG